MALTFPAERSRSLADADAAVVRLRVRPRLARELSLLTDGKARHAAETLAVIGRVNGKYAAVWLDSKRKFVENDES